MSKDETEIAAQDEAVTNAASGGDAPVSQDASQLEADHAGIPTDDTGAHPGGAPPADASAASAAEPSADEMEQSLRDELRAELAGELSARDERIAQLERELATERERATDYMHRWQQAQADFSNFRRRTQQDEQQIASLAATQAMALMLPALDSLERAFKTLPETLHHLTWIDGIALVELQLRRALDAHGVAPFEPRPGEPLDPNRHQPIARAETSDQPEGAIVEVVQRGYELSGKVLRPALVRVAVAPAQPPPPTPDAAAGDGGP